MNVTEASLVNVLCRALLGNNGNQLGREPSVDDAVSALAGLAERSSKAINAGWNGGQVVARKDRLEQLLAARPAEAAPASSATLVETRKAARKLSSARKLGLQVLVRATGGTGRVSNVTSLPSGYVYWQTARWLVDEGYATEEHAAGGPFITLTEQGRALAAAARVT